jgi:hypothetical protein
MGALGGGGGINDMTKMIQYRREDFSRISAHALK